uniref:Uncharacterized protein n=1 Tax=Micrurus carvalhoi TaxID=3147026 RepID=A0A2H6NI18_9SAUR
MALMILITSMVTVISEQSYFALFHLYHMMTYHLCHDKLISLKLQNIDEYGYKGALVYLNFKKSKKCSYNYKDNSISKTISPNLVLSSPLGTRIPEFCNWKF